VPEKKPAGRPTVLPRTYSTAHVARLFGISVPTVQRWVDGGELRAWKTPGGHRRIDADDADRLFARRRAAPRVMVVDDSADDRDLLAALVAEALPGAALEVHENGIQALVALGQSAPDIVITDVVMPYLNGVEMLHQLSARCVVRPRLIIAVTSLSAQQLARLGGLPAGVQRVGKPIEPAPFVNLLREAAAE